MLFSSGSMQDSSKQKNLKSNQAKNFATLERLAFVLYVPVHLPFFLHYFSESGLPDVAKVTFMASQGGSVIHCDIPGPAASSGQSFHFWALLFIHP